MELLFCELELVFSYFTAMRSYLEQHGTPEALYSDKAEVCRVNRKQPQGATGFTQISRPSGSLNCDILCASTPAAKGRVAKPSTTLRDTRLLRAGTQRRTTTGPSAGTPR